MQHPEKRRRVSDADETSSDDIMLTPQGVRAAWLWVWGVGWCVMWLWIQFSKSWPLFKEERDLSEFFLREVGFLFVAGSVAIVPALAIRQLGNWLDWVRSFPTEESWDSRMERRPRGGFALLLWKIGALPRLKHHWEVALSIFVLGIVAGAGAGYLLLHDHKERIVYRESVERFELQGIGGQLPIVYKLDKATGKVWHIYGGRETLISEDDPPK